MSNFLVALIYFIAVALVAFLGSASTQSAFSTGWYDSLNKPPLTPPNYVFPIVWTVLYILIFLAGTLTDQQMRNSCDPCLTNFRIAFALGLIFNLVWSLLFFGQRNIVGALIANILLVVVNLYILTLMARQSQLAFFFYFLYTLWTIYALYLTAGVWLLN